MWIYEVWAINYFYYRMSSIGNGFIETLFRQAEFNGIDKKNECKKETQNEKIEPVKVFLLNFIW